MLLSSMPSWAQQHCDEKSHALSAPAGQFQDNGDGTVTDTRTRLMWMRCSAGQQWTGATCAGPVGSMSLASARDTARAINERGDFFYKDWRLPRIHELASIAERQCENPRINLALFPNTPAEFYWSTSTRQAKGTVEAAFALSFGIEGVRYDAADDGKHVRLVRNAQ